MLPPSGIPEPWPIQQARALFPSERAGQVGAVHGEPLLSDPLPHDRPYLAVNMVETLDGRVIANGSAEGLGSRTDRSLMVRLRQEADALLHGANTLRRDPILARFPPRIQQLRSLRGQPAQPHGIVVSRSGVLPADTSFFATATPEWRRYVYSVAPANLPPQAGLLIRRLSEGSQGLQTMMHELRSEGIARIICEGGPILNASLLAADLVDELFVTLSGRVVGGQGDAHLIDGIVPHRALSLRSVYEREGELLLRYGVIR